jgi:predicted RNA-binding Zn ribbon-like protein
VRFDPGGAARLEGDGLVASMLAIIARAQADGTWPRMKACRAEDCRWAFYDRSRNRSRAWCSMSECGNRAKARSYRARQR